MVLNLDNIDDFDNDIKLLKELNKYKKGQVSDEILSAIFENIVDKTITIPKTNSYNVFVRIFELVNVPESFYTTNFKNLFCENILNICGRDTFNCIYKIIESGYTFTNSDIKLIRDMRGWFCNVLDVLFSIKKSNIHLKINFTTLLKENFCLETWFITKNYSQFLEFYDIIKFDYKLFVFNYLSKSYFDPAESLEIIKNLSHFFKKYNIKYDSDFLIELIRKHGYIFNVKKLELYDVYFNEFKSYYLKDIVSKKNLKKIINSAGYHDHVKDTNLKILINDFNIEFEKLDLEDLTETNIFIYILKYIILDDVNNVKIVQDENDSEEDEDIDSNNSDYEDSDNQDSVNQDNEDNDEEYIEYDEKTNEVLYASYNTKPFKYFNTTVDMIQCLYNGSIDKKFLEFVKTNTAKYNNFILRMERCGKMKKDKEIYTYIINSFKQYCLNQEIFELFFDVDVETFLENKFLPTNEFIRSCYYDDYSLEVSLNKCTKYGFYCTPDLFDHLILVYFSCTLVNSIKRRNKKIYDYRHFNEEICDIICSVSIYVNDETTFNEKYKKYIIDKIELYKKIDKFNTNQMVEYIRNNEITNDIILIMCKNPISKNIQICMSEYLKKINTKNITDIKSDTNSDTKSVNKKVVKVVKKIVK